MSFVKITFKKTEEVLLKSDIDVNDLKKISDTIFNYLLEKTFELLRDVEIDTSNKPQSEKKTELEKQSLLEKSLEKDVTITKGSPIAVTIEVERKKEPSKEKYIKDQEPIFLIQFKRIKENLWKMTLKCKNPSSKYKVYINEIENLDKLDEEEILWDEDFVPIHADITNGKLWFTENSEVNTNANDFITITEVTILKDIKINIEKVKNSLHVTYTLEEIDSKIRLPSKSTKPIIEIV